MQRTNLHWMSHHVDDEGLWLLAGELEPRKGAGRHEHLEGEGEVGGRKEEGCWVRRWKKGGGEEEEG